MPFCLSGISLAFDCFVTFKSFLVMKLRLLFKYVVLVSCFITTSFFSAHSQSTDPKFNVMMQGFWWDSYQDPTVASEGGLYNFLKARAGQLQATGIDLVWTPPPSDGSGMAYFPQQLYVYSNSHGTEAQLRAMLTEFKGKNIHGMADVVANHRNGTTAWADFTNPTWGCDVIVDNDEVKGVAGQIQPCSNQLDEGEGFAGVRDMNHKSTTVQNGYKTYLANLKGLGFDSWRWDFTKGYPAKYVGEYNASSSPYFSVGEYFDANISLLSNWVNGSGNTLTGTTKKSASFDFSLYYILDRAVKGAWSELNNGGNMPGFAGSFGFAEYAVTFSENHDAHNIAGNDNLMKANAYILTHPGIPMVFMKHWLNNKQKMNELIAVRKQNNINAWSTISIANSSTFYAAYIDGKVAVKIGPGTWSPTGSGWILNTSGTDYAVWSKTNITTPTVIPEPYLSITMVGPAVGGWSTDVPMTTTDGITYKLYSQVCSAGAAKFRAGLSWTSNWGDSSFPAGIGTQDGKNIPVIAGTYNVTFNVQTGAFNFGPGTPAPPNNFQKLYFTGAATNNQSVQLKTIDGYNYSLLNYQFATGGVKIRDSAGTNLWGSASFPTGNATLNGASIPVTAGLYSVKYNRITGYYDFQTADTSVSIVGPAVGGWSQNGVFNDVAMKSTDLGINYSLVYTVAAGELKFRKDRAWSTNWGGPKTDSTSSGFSGTGTQGGANIPVPAGTFKISFNTTTGAYSFATTNPVIHSFNPASSSVGGTVTIKGDNLSGATIVSFGGVNASSFSVLNDSTISAVVGNGATGKVVVTTPVGVATSAANFTYVALPTISSFTPAFGNNGTSVTITGTNFSGATAVKFGGVAAASFNVVSSTSIAAIVGNGASGSVSVTTPVATASLQGFIFGCVPPSIGSVTAGATKLCAGATTNLAANSVAGTSAVVTWWTGSNGTGTNLGTGTTLNNVGVGTYYARVTANCGTPAESSIVIYPTVGLTIYKSDPLCFGNTGGGIRISAAGGLAPYKYKFDSLAATQYKTSSIFKPLKAGNYKFTVKDSLGCATISAVVSLVEPTRVIGALSKTDASCIGKADGTITVDASGGMLPYAYKVGVGGVYSDYPTLKGIKAGYYKVYVKDANGCVRAVDSINVGQVNVTCLSKSAIDNAWEAAIQSAMSLVLTPNPASNEFTLRIFSNSKEPVSVKVFNEMGYLLQTMTGSPEQYFKFGKSFTPGMYLIQATQGETMKTAKAIKLK